MNLENGTAFRFVKSSVGLLGSFVTLTINRIPREDLLKLYSLIILCVCLCLLSSWVINYRQVLWLKIMQIYFEKVCGLVYFDSYTLEVIMLMGTWFCTVCMKIRYCHMINHRFFLHLCVSRFLHGQLECRLI